MSRPIKTLPEGLRTSLLVNAHYMIRDMFPQVYAFLVTNQADFVGLQFKEKDGGCILIAKRVGPDGDDEVMFCSGYEAISTLADLERALGRGSWKKDKPWSPPGSSEKEGGA